jgi:ribosomal protein L40E
MALGRSLLVFEGKRMRCASCNTENPEDAKFCIQCASALKRLCKKCGSENPPAARFCAQCATALTEGQPSRPAADPTSSAFSVIVDKPERHVIEGERKTVTALFADIPSD